ncbi:MAG: hypothetical protein ACE5IZ_07330 [Dehalococcoidia bacterium]
MTTQLREVQTVSGQNFAVMRVGGCIDLAMRRRRDARAKIPLSINEARQLADLLLEAAELEEYLVECTIGG